MLPVPAASRPRAIAQTATPGHPPLAKPPGLNSHSRSYPLPIPPAPLHPLTPPPPSASACRRCAAAAAGSPAQRAPGRAARSTRGGAASAGCCHRTSGPEGGKGVGQVRALWEGSRVGTHCDGKAAGQVHVQRERQASKRGKSIRWVLPSPVNWASNGGSAVEEACWRHIAEACLSDTL